MQPQNIVAEIRNLMGYHDIIALDNGVYKIWFARNYLAYQPNTIPSIMRSPRWGPDYHRQCFCHALSKSQGHVHLW